MTEITLSQLPWDSLTASSSPIPLMLFALVLFMVAGWKLGGYIVHLIERKLGSK